jgi:DNA-binding MarR family transcriptional regulator
MTAERPDLAAALATLTSRLIAAERPILDAHDLSMWGYIVLSRLRDGEAPTQHVLAADIGYDKTRLIAVLDDLEHRGLVTRTPDPADRRARVVSLTAAGEERQATTQRAIHAMEDRLLAHLSGDDRHALRHLLDRALTVPGGG